MPKGFRTAKKQSRNDFERKKRKLDGKKESSTSTDTSFKAKSIVMPEQSLRDVVQDEAVNYRNLSLGDLLSQLQHYGRGVRKEALLGLMDLFKKHSTRLFPCRALSHKRRASSSMDESSSSSSSTSSRSSSAFAEETMSIETDAQSSENLASFVNSSLPLIQDEESSVRKTLLQLWENLFQVVRPEAFAPFLSLCVAHAKTAMTNTNTRVQQSGSRFLALCTSNFPDHIRFYLAELIPIYLLLIQPTKRSTAVMVKNAGPMSLTQESRSLDRSPSSHHQVLEDFAALLHLVFPPIHAREMLTESRACQVETPLSTYQWRSVETSSDFNVISMYSFGVAAQCELEQLENVAESAKKESLLLSTKGASEIAEQVLGMWLENAPTTPGLAVDANALHSLYVIASCVSSLARYFEQTIVARGLSSSEVDEDTSTHGGLSANAPAEEQASQRRQSTPAVGAARVSANHFRELRNTVDEKATARHEVDSALTRILCLFDRHVRPFFPLGKDTIGRASSEKLQEVYLINLALSHAFVVALQFSGDSLTRKKRRRLEESIVEFLCSTLSGGQGRQSVAQSEQIALALPVFRDLLRMCPTHHEELLEAFGTFWKSCHPLSVAKMRCVHFLAEVLKEQHTYELSDEQILSWVALLPRLLWQLCNEKQDQKARMITRILLQWGATANTALQRQSYDSLQAHLIPLLYTLVRRVHSTTGRPLEKRVFGPWLKMMPSTRHEILALFSYFSELSAATYRALAMCAVADGTAPILRKCLLLASERVLRRQADSPLQRAALASMLSMITTLLAEFSSRYEIPTPLSPIWLAQTRHPLRPTLECLLEHLHQLDELLDLGSGGSAIALAPSLVLLFEEAVEEESWHRVVFLLNWSVLLRANMHDASLSDAEVRSFEETILTQGILSYLMSDRVRELLGHTLGDDTAPVNDADPRSSTGEKADEGEDSDVRMTDPAPSSSTTMGILPVAKVRPLAPLLDALSAVPSSLCDTLRALLTENGEAWIQQGAMSRAVVRELLSELATL